MGGGVGGRGSVVALQPHSRGPKSGVRVRGIAGSIAAPFGMIVISGVLFVGGTQRNLSDLIAFFFWVLKLDIALIRPSWSTGSSKSIIIYNGSSNRTLNVIF